jgi:hypothetical protein
MAKDPLHRKILVWLATLFITAVLVFPLLVLPLRQLIFIRQSGEMRKLDATSDKLEKMVFSAEAFSQLCFTRKDREFIFRGNMYDIRSVSKSGNQVVVLALWDVRESIMLQAFQSQDKPIGPNAPGASKVGFMPYFLVRDFHPDFRTDKPDKGICGFAPFTYTDPCCRMSSPPPEEFAAA